jgi:CBS domain-containing protein
VQERKAAPAPSGAGAHLRCGGRGCPPGRRLVECGKGALETRYKSFPVVAGALLVGVIAREDVLRALRRAAAGEHPIRDPT